MPESILEQFRPLYYPNAVVVVGASSNPEKIGAFALRAVISSNFPGHIYPVHAGGAEQIMGLKAYPSIQAIPETCVEMFIFAIPAEQILQSMDTAIAKGCRAAVILTAGFKEIGGEGLALEAELKAKAQAGGVKVIGPNSLGLFAAYGNLNASFVPGLSECFKGRGKAAFVSQSGGVGNTLLSRCLEDNMEIHSFTCLGNRLNVEFADLVEYFTADTRVRAIGLFIEGTDDGRRFYTTARRCSQQKPVVVFGTGYSDTARQAARSHTGSMASSEALYRAAFHQAGLVQAESVDEMVDATKVLSMCPPPPADKVAIITHSAGPSIIMVDILEGSGVRLAELSPETKEELCRTSVPAFGSAANPVDLTGMGGFDKRLYVEAMRTLVKDPEVGVIITLYTTMFEYSLSFPIPEFARIARESGKPTIVAFVTPFSFNKELYAWEAEGIPVFTSPERAARAAVNLVRYYRGRARLASLTDQSGEPPVRGPEPPGQAKLADLVAAAAAPARREGRQLLLEHEVKDLLAAMGVKVARGRLATSAAEAVAAARETGWPVAMKIVSPQVIHKSDAGGVRLNISDEEAVRQAYDDIMAAVAENFPRADLRGVLVQPMARPGLEVIIGTLNDPQFGPAAMFGLGGVWVETMSDVSFRLLPLTRQEAREMVAEIKGYPLLAGHRGRPAVDLEALEELILTVSRLVTAGEGIGQLDLNPVILYPDGYSVVDARLSLS
ncbi:MAG: CoA-binding protein [Clostridia bacterium]|nr:MAG: CoA-binding protein [Clostridia bacterium]